MTLKVNETLEVISSYFSKSFGKILHEITHWRQTLYIENQRILILPDGCIHDRSVFSGQVTWKTEETSKVTGKTEETSEVLSVFS